MRSMRSYKKPKEVQRYRTTFILLKTVAVLSCEKRRNIYETDEQGVTVIIKGDETTCETGGVDQQLSETLVETTAY